MVLGLERGTVQVVAHSPEWAILFEAERKRLSLALGQFALDIQHIGSTSVPGLDAKPILDIGIAVAAESDVTACVPLLEALGYRYDGDRGADEGHFFDLGAEAMRTHYLHMLLSESTEWRNYLRFRDALRAKPEHRDAYMRLKHKLAALHAGDRGAYTAAKAAFIQKVLAKAE